MGSSSGFDLVKVAEGLLEDAKRLAAATRPGDDDENEAALRRSIVETANRIEFEVAPKMEVVKRDWVALADVAAWNIFIEWEAFDHIPLDGHISIGDLARAVDAEESLVGRITNQLLATRKLRPGPVPGTVAHSRVSPLFRTEHPASPLCTVAVGNAMRPFAHWPSFFETYGRREPVPGPSHTPFSFAWGRPELAPWEIKALHPAYARAFARSMRAREMVGGDTVLVGPAALYDLGWVGVEACARGPTDPVIVDVGGGLGQLVRDILADVEGIKPGQCVLQDRGEVIEEARRLMVGYGLEGVVMMEHDFHTEQPVKGKLIALVFACALVYMLRRILLDYSDYRAIGILRRLAEALPADNPKARVIIIEERLLETPTPHNSLVDMAMLNLGGKLRNEAKFREIASAAGLKVVGYFVREGDPKCVVECAKALNH